MSTKKKPPETVVDSRKAPGGSTPGVSPKELLRSAVADLSQAVKHLAEAEALEARIRASKLAGAPKVGNATKPR
jgi:hypothetical protein